VQEEERERLARELHDEIGQCVTAIHADAFTIHRAAAATDSIIHESATAIMDITARIKHMVRGMLQRLRPAAIQRLGLEGALRELETAFRQRNPRTTCSLTVNLPANDIESDLAMAIYRVVQEGLTNIARHAHASQVTIEVNAGEVLTVSLRDDGLGFDPHSVTEGFGLLGMKERTMGFGGKMTLESVAGQGSLIRAEFPWPA
jgi:two-component system, NarL family, sensor histidine kinase UhpB